MHRISAAQGIEIAANLGVIVTLIFLAFQIQQERKASELQTVLDVSNAWISVNQAHATNTETMRIYVTGLYKPDSLSTVEAAQFSLLLRMYMNQAGKVRDLYDRGLVNEETYQRTVRQMTRFLQTPGGMRFAESDWNLSDRTREAMEPYIELGPADFLLLGRDPSTIE